MKKRVISAILMVGLFIPFLLKGGTPFGIIMTILAILGLYELINIKEMEKKQGNFLVILVMILLFGMISFVTNLASPMGDILKNQFSVANWMGTLGVLANFIAYAVMGIPAGNMLQG